MEITPEHENEINKNIERASSFLQRLMDNPSEMEKIPNGSHIRLLDSDSYEFSNPSPAG